MTNLRLVVLSAVLASLPGCMTPPRVPVAAAASPRSEDPADWSLRQVQYDVGENGVASAFRRDDIRVAFVRRCRMRVDKGEVTEMRGRDDTIGPHLDNALAFWYGMPFDLELRGCHVLQLMFLRSRGASAIPIGKDVPTAPRSEHAIFVKMEEAHHRCISCPQNVDLHGKAVPAGRTILKGCVNESGTVESGSITTSGGEAADLAALWLFGIATYRPFVVNGQPRAFCSLFVYNVINPVY